MKRLIIVVLLCSLFLGGCVFSRSEQNTEMMPTQPTNDDSSCMQIPNLYYTYDEYNAYISKNSDKLPADFITWDDISILGEVRSIGFSNWTYYRYSIWDSAGQSLMIEVNHAPKIQDKKQLTFSADMLVGNTLRDVHSDNKEPFTVIRNGVEYGYSIVGRLITVTFYKDNIQYKISGNTYNYPTDRTDTFLGKLISADEAVANAALAEFAEKLSK